MENTTIEAITLETLRDFATSLPPDKYIDLNDSESCLVAQYTGGMMVGHHAVQPRNWKAAPLPVPPAFGEMTFAADSDKGYKARDVRDAIDQLIDGRHPKDVAEWLENQ